MKFVTVTIGGITQDVPEADVSLYLRAGYSVVTDKSAVKDPEPVTPPVDPAPEQTTEPEPEKGKGKHK